SPTLFPSTTLFRSRTEVRFDYFQSTQCIKRGGGNQSINPCCFSIANMLKDSFGLSVHNAGENRKSAIDNAHGRFQNFLAALASGESNFARRTENKKAVHAGCNEAL